MEGGEGDGRAAEICGRRDWATLVARVPDPRLIPKGHGSAGMAHWSHLRSQVSQARRALCYCEQPQRGGATCDSQTDSVSVELAQTVKLPFVAASDRVVLLTLTATLIEQWLSQIALRRRAVQGQDDALAALRLLLCVYEPCGECALLGDLLRVARSHVLGRGRVRAFGRHRAMCR